MTMFTGIVEETGKVLSFEKGNNSWKLKVAANKVLQNLEPGDSIAVNGCCLTATVFDSGSIEFDLLEETVRLTSIKQLGPDGLVNLERSLSFNGKVGGHFVTGHVDETGIIDKLEQRGDDYYLRINVSPEGLRYLVYKGCIAIDGISLTVAEVDATGFAVWLIPHTLAVTNLSERKSGDIVNLEFDLLAKYVEKLSLPVKP